MDNDTKADPKLSVVEMDALPEGSVVAIMWPKDIVRSAWLKKPEGWLATSREGMMYGDANKVRYFAIGAAGQPDCEMRVLYEAPPA